MTNLFRPRTQIVQVPTAPKVEEPAPEVPAVTPPAVMPDPDPTAPANVEARRRAEQDAMRRAGRQSTILTTPQNRGSTYTATRLGTGV